MQDQLSRLGVAITCAMLAVLLTVGAIGLLGAALYLALLTVVLPPVAAALTAAAAVLLAAIILLIGRVISRRRTAPRGRVERHAGMSTQLGVMGSLSQDIGQEVGAFARAHSGKAVLAALIAGFAFGISPRLRRSLWQLLR